MSKIQKKPVSTGKLIAAQYRSEYEKRAASVMRHYCGNESMRERVNSAFMSLAISHTSLFTGRYTYGELTPLLIGAAKRGVLLDGKEAAIIPRGNKLTMVVMAEGVRRIISTDSNIVEMHVVVINKGDDVSYNPMSNEMPVITLREDKFSLPVPVGVVASARTKSGQVIVEIIGVEEIRKKWKEPDYTQGGKWVEEWYRNIAVKRLYKRLPLAFVQDGGAASQWDSRDIEAAGGDAEIVDGAMIEAAAVEDGANAVAGDGDDIDVEGE